MKKIVIRHSDVRVERNPIYGSWVVAARINGVLVRKVYQGYSKVESIKLFVANVRAGAISA